MGNLFCLAHNWFEDFISFLNISNWFQSDLGLSREFFPFSFSHNINFILLNGPLRILFSSSSGLGSVCAIIITWSLIRHLLNTFSLIWIYFLIPQNLNFQSKQKISWNLEQPVLLESNDGLAMFVNQICITIQRST